MALKVKHSETVEVFDKLPDDGGIAIPVWQVISGESRATTYRRIASGALDSFKLGKLRRLRVGSCRRALKEGI
jgi:hypothetical protein